MSSEEISDRAKRSIEGFSTDGDEKFSELVSTLQGQLDYEKDARREDRFVYLVLLTILLDVVFFSVIDGFGGPLALLVLELLILIPLANRLGMQEIAQIISGVLNRVAGRSDTEE